MPRRALLHSARKGFWNAGVCFWACAVGQLILGVYWITTEYSEKFENVQNRNDTAWGVCSLFGLGPWTDRWYFGKRPKSKRTEALF